MSEKKLYPLKFHPIFKEKIWGGQKLNKVLGKEVSSQVNCGESWELSAVSGDVSVVNGGDLDGVSLTSILEQYKTDLVGEKVYAQYGNEFPLLIKYIDAAQDLSIQVHPDDKLAEVRHNCLGKTEMWYVMQADKNASLIAGFNKEVSKEEYLESLTKGTLTSILNEEKVKDHDVFFIPAGRVHTIGKGLLIAEIQQTSDVTYRIYDFDRKDKNGNLRELHTEQAVDAIDYKHYKEYKTAYNDQVNEAVELVKSNYFDTFKLSVDGQIDRDYSKIDSFVIYTVVEGEGEIITDDYQVTCKLGDVFLIPACCKNVQLRSIKGLQLLETTA